MILFLAVYIVSVYPKIKELLYLFKKNSYFIFKILTICKFMVKNKWVIRNSNPNIFRLFLGLSPEEDLYTDQSFGNK